MSICSSVVQCRPTMVTKTTVSYCHVKLARCPALRWLQFLSFLSSPSQTFSSLGLCGCSGAIEWRRGIGEALGYLGGLYSHPAAMAIVVNDEKVWRGYVYDDRCSRLGFLRRARWLHGHWCFQFQMPAIKARTRWHQQCGALTATSRSVGMS